MNLSPNLLDLFEKYINIDTSQPDGKNYVKVMDLLEPELRKIGFSTKRLHIPKEVVGAENRVNLIATMHKGGALQPDTNAQTLIIYNHIDVVPAAYKDAFKFRIEKDNGKGRTDGDKSSDKAYGRGTADHKGSTIAVLDALGKIDPKQLRFNLIFLLTTDEETYQTPQLNYLADHLGLTPEKVATENIICFDPDTFAGGITNSHLGIYQFTIKCKGKSVHSGMSHMGTNAIEEIMSLYPVLDKIKHKYVSAKSDIVSFPQDGKSEVVRSGFNVNLIQGGLAGNIIPDVAEITVDLRVSPEFDLAQEREWIKDTLQKEFENRKGIFEINDGVFYEGHTTQSKETDKLESILKKVSGESGQYCVMGSTPVADWTKKLGMPHYGLGVARYDSNVHGVNENCALKDIKVLGEVFAKYITE